MFSWKASVQQEAGMQRGGSLTRRALMFTAAATALLPQVVTAATNAEVIYLGGPILTMDDANPRVQAVGVTAGRIIAAGSAEEVAKLKGPETKIVDLAGRAMLPGFVDSHGHVMVGGLQALSANVQAPPDGPNADITAIQSTLTEWAAANSEIVKSANLIIGFGYDNAQLAELRHPTRDDLDAVSKEIPVIVVHQSGHLAALNSKALEVVGYSAETPNPVGGVIQRMDDGKEPNGVLEEVAFFGAISALMRNVGPLGLMAMAEAGSRLWASFGYTTAQEGRSVPATAQILKAVADAGRFPVDVVTYCDVLVDRDFIKTNVGESYANRYRVGGAKLTIDGSPQGFTAWRDRPYFAPVGNYPPGYAGYPAATNEQVIDAVNWAFENSIQILTHSNGEAASDLLIAAISAARAKFGPADRRNVLVHGQFLRVDQVDSFVSLDVFPSLFPMHTFYWGDWHREHTVGPSLADNISPTGWFLRRGSKFGTHHDAPVAFPDSMRILDATVTRRSRSGDIIGPDQRVDVITALKAMTIWPAWQHFEEANKGSIEVGKLADFVILSDDPTAVDPETLDQLKVTETVKEGVSVYVIGQKKAELMRGKDYLNPGMFEMFRQIYFAKMMSHLPENYRTAEAQAHLEAGYDDCAAGLVLAEMALPVADGLLLAVD
jgi:predicted amidohydrolase YtcJ